MKKTTGNLSIYVPQKCPQKVGRETPFTVAVRRHGQKIASMQNESPALKLFYYHTPAPKTFVYLAYYNCVYDVYSSLYDTMQLNYWCTKAFRACSY